MKQTDNYLLYATLRIIDYPQLVEVFTFLLENDTDNFTNELVVDWGDGTITKAIVRDAIRGSNTQCKVLSSGVHLYSPGVYEVKVTGGFAATTEWYGGTSNNITYNTVSNKSAVPQAEYEKIVPLLNTIYQDYGITTGTRGEAITAWGTYLDANTYPRFFSQLLYKPASSYLGDNSVPMGGRFMEISNLYINPIFYSAPAYNYAYTSGSYSYKLVDGVPYFPCAGEFSDLPSSGTLPNAKVGSCLPTVDGYTLATHIQPMRRLGRCDVGLTEFSSKLPVDLLGHYLVTDWMHSDEVDSLSDFVAYNDNITNINDFPMVVPTLLGKDQYKWKPGDDTVIGYRTEHFNGNRIWGNIHGRFDDTNAAGTLGPLLNGSQIRAETIGGFVTHEYTTHRDTSDIAYILMTGPFSEWSKDLGTYTNIVEFDVTTWTIKVRAEPSDYISESANVNDDRTNGKVFINLKFVYTDGTYDVDYFQWFAHGRKYDPCHLNGTPVLMWDGSVKPIEQIKYDDILLCYDHFRGKLVPQFPYYIRKAGETDNYLKIVLEDNTELKIARGHCFFDCGNKRFLNVDLTNYTDIDLETTKFVKVDSDNNLHALKIKSITREFLPEGYTSTYHILYTTGVQSYFTSRILNGNKFFNTLGSVKDDYTMDLTPFNYIRDNHLEESYEDYIKEYGYMHRGMFYGHFCDVMGGGLKLGMGGAAYSSVEEGVKDIKEGIERFWNNAQPVPQIDGVDAYYVALWRKDGTIEKQLYKEGETIELPEGNWYCIGDAKLYNIMYEVKMNTILEEV